MILRVQAIRCLTLALAGVLLLLGARTASAQAEYGELGSPIEEVGKVDEQGAHAFGIDPTDHSLYIADEVPKTETYRVQKFDSSGQLLAEVRFKANANSAVLGKFGLEGIAIDPAAKRVYLLEVQTASEELDPEATAAATLYAFSTEPENGKLVPAKNEKGEPMKEGVLAKLGPQSTKTKTALLDPHGIAVDPANGDVVILGQEDEQSLGESPELRTAVQLIQSNGKLSSRYVDLENCLDGANGSGGEPACEEESPGRGAQPFSPIVSQSGKIYVERTGEVWAIPTAAETHPKRVFALGSGQTLVEFPKGEVTAEAVGSSMAFAPEGADEGRIYLTAGINSSAGVLALAYVEHGETAEAKELGWTGGQSEASAAKCVVPQAGSEGLWLASGGSEDLFVLDPRRHGLTGRPASVDVFEFGPGGEGCPHASVTPPTVKVEEKTISPVPLGKTAMLSSEVSEANAEGAEWKFKDLTTGQEEAPADTGYQFQTTSLEHQFEHAGEYEVTEIIETDDFATPKLEVTQKVQVGEQHLVVELSYPETAVVGRPAGFEAKVDDSHEPHDPHLEYVWKFGDGTERREKATTAELSTQHTYLAEGTESVTLEVTDAHGSSGEATQVVSVGKEEVREELKEEPVGRIVEAPQAPPKAPVGPSSPVQGSQTKHNPDVTLVGSSLKVSPAGAVALRVACPPDETSCVGTVTLHTLAALDAGAGSHGTAGHKRGKGRRVAVVTLASGSFGVTGGRMQALTLRLSAAGLMLLVRSHVLRVQVTLTAHDPAGATHTTQTTVTLRAVVATGKVRRKH